MEQMLDKSELIRMMFQSAGRIWGFWNTGRIGAPGLNPQVSIRRADLGLLEHSIHLYRLRYTLVSIRRADLGLLERDGQ